MATDREVLEGHDVRIDVRPHGCVPAYWHGEDVARTALPLPTLARALRVRELAKGYLAGLAINKRELRRGDLENVIDWVATQP
jgi:hypothetical protein